MARKIQIVIPDETSEKVKKFARKHNLGGSATITASVEYFTWLTDQMENEGYSLVLEKKEGFRTTRKELVVPRFLVKKK